RTCDERCAELRGGRAKSQRRGNAGAVHDSARCDHRHIELAHEQASQSECAETIIWRIRIENAAMTARFVALRHDSLHACTNCNATFCHARCRCDEYDAGRAQGSDTFGRPQPQMKTDDSRPRSDDSGQHRVVIEKAAIDLAQACRWLCAELRELRTKMLEPRCLARHISLRRSMTEHIDVERAVRARSYFRDHLTGA